MMTNAHNEKTTKSKHSYQLSDLEFLEDVDDFKCRRCNRITIHHYQSNCQHHFCKNCKHILHDGSGKWKCPKCEQFITSMSHSVDVTEKMKKLKVTCVNKKYNCNFVCNLEELNDHLARCKNTKEASLPALFTGKNTKDLVIEEIRKLNERMDNMQESLAQVVDKVSNLETVRKSEKLEMEMVLEQLKSNMNGLSSDLHEHSIRINKEVSDMKREDAHANSKIEEMRNEWQKNSLDQQCLLDKTKANLNEISEHFKTELQIGMESMKKDRLDNEEMIVNVERNLANVSLRVDHLDVVAKMLGEKTDLRNDSVSQLLTKVEEKFSQKLDHCEMRNEAHQTAFQEEVKFNHSVTKRLEKRLLILEERLEKQRHHEDKLRSDLKHLIHNQQSFKSNIEESIKSETIKVDEKIASALPELIKTEVEQKLESIKEEILKAKETQPNFLNGSVFDYTKVYTWKIRNISKIKEQTMYECQSRAFSLSDYNCGAKVKLKKFESGNIYMYLAFQNSKKAGQPVDLKMFPQISYIVKDASDNEEKKHLIRCVNCLINSISSYGIFQYEKFIAERFQFFDTRYVIDDAVEIEVLVEPPHLLKSAKTKNGILEWKISEYKKRKERAIEGLERYCYSPYFYTSAEGYRVQIKMWLNGYDENIGKGLTAEVNFLTGEFDSFLHKSFKHKTTITLIGQTSTDIAVEQDIDDKRDYFIYLDSFETIESNYVINDELACKIIIESAYKKF